MLYTVSVTAALLFIFFVCTAGGLAIGHKMGKTGYWGKPMPSVFLPEGRYQPPTEAAMSLSAVVSGGPKDHRELYLINFDPSVLDPKRPFTVLGDRILQERS